MNGRIKGQKLSEETLKNEVLCLVCSQKLKNPIALSKHLKFQHQLKSQEYYNQFLKKETEGFCMVCGKETRFVNISEGYKTLCSHACSGKATTGENNPFYGHKHTEETKKLISESREGFTHTDETKKQISESLKGIQRTPEYCQRMSEIQMGHEISNETKIKISESRMGQESGFKGLHHTEKTKKILGEKRKLWWVSVPEDFKKEYVKNRKLWWEVLSPELKKLYRNRQLSFWKEFRKTESFISWNYKRIKNSLAKVCERPNKFEQNCQKALDLEFPGKFKYVGDGSVLINFKSPDFINEEDKVIVLCHGIYWHLEKYGLENCCENKKLIEKRDAKPFEEAGYRVIVLWEDEV